MSFFKHSTIVAALMLLLTAASGCDHIDNKTIPRFSVRIDLGSYALWNTYGVSGMGQFRIFNREKDVPSNFPFNVNTYTGYGGVLLMACPVEISPEVTLSMDASNFEAVCPRCGSRFNPLTGDGGPVSGVAINNKVGMRQYHVYPSNGGYVIAN